MNGKIWEYELRNLIARRTEMVLPRLSDPVLWEDEIFRASVCRLTLSGVLLSRVAHEEGLLALEDCANGIAEGPPEGNPMKFLGEACADFPLLRRGILLIVDGTEPYAVADILTSQILLEADPKKQYFGLLILRQVIMVQVGASHYSILEGLCGLMPDDVAQSAREQAGAFSRDMDTPYRLWQAEKTEQAVAGQTARLYEMRIHKSADMADADTLATLERELSSRHDREVQRILRDIDNTYLVSALCCMSDAARDVIKRNVSSRLWQIFLEDMEKYLTAHTDEELLQLTQHAADGCLDVITYLHDTGEIT